MVSKFLIQRSLFPVIKCSDQANGKYKLCNDTKQEFIYLSLILINISDIKNFGSSMHNIFIMRCLEIFMKKLN